MSDVADLIDAIDWAKKVIEGLRGTNVKLERLFDAVYAERP